MLTVWFLVPQLLKQILLNRENDAIMLIFVTNYPKSIVSTYLLHNISRGHSRVRRTAQSNDFPNQYTKAPNIGLYGKYIIVKRLGCHPSNWQATLALPFINVRGNDVSGEPKIRHLARVILGDEDISRSEISVYYLWNILFLTQWYI